MLDIRQIIHISVEIIVIASILFFVTQRTKKLSTQISDLSQRIEDQEDIIQKQEHTIAELASQIKTLTATVKNIADVRPLDTKPKIPQSNRQAATKHTERATPKRPRIVVTPSPAIEVEDDEKAVTPIKTRGEKPTYMEADIPMSYKQPIHVIIAKAQEKESQLRDEDRTWPIETSSKVEDITDEDAELEAELAEELAELNGTDTTYHED